MEWLTGVRTAIRYIEDNLTNDISAQDVSDQVHISSFFLQRGFLIMTGYGIGEYIRSRRLFEAAKELRETDEKIIDIAFRYCYETPESFSKAFQRFHGSTPLQVRNGAQFRSFLPINITLTVHGGDQMDYKITPMFPFRLI